MGLPCPDVGHPRVDLPMIDDGPWAGVPIGGLGTGEHRADASRRFRALAPRGRAASVRARSRGRLLDLVGRPGGGGTATVLSTLRPDVLPDWGWTLPEGGGMYHALFPRAWQSFEPGALGVRLVGEQLSPVIAGDLVSSALPVGAFEWWVENPGPDPLTVGIMLSWADPAADPRQPALAGAWHETVASPDVDGAILHAPVGAPSGLRGTFAVAASRAPGVTVTVRNRFDALADRELWDDFADRRPARAERRPAPERGRRAARGRRRGDRRARTGRASIAPFRGRLGPPRRRVRGRPALVEALHGDVGPDRRAGVRPRPARARGGATLARRDRGLAATDPRIRRAARLVQGGLFNELYFLVDGGSFWEAGEVDGPAPDPDDPGRFALLECPDYPYYDSVDVDFYASFAVLRLYPELEIARIRDLLAAIAVDDPAWSPSWPPGAEAVRKVGGTVPHDVGGPDDDPFHRPNRYDYQDVNDWKDLGPKFVLQVWRDAVAAGPDGDALIREAWPTVEALLTHLGTRDRDGDGLPEHDGLPDQTYDTWPMHGPSAYGGSLWLGALAAAEAMAGRLGETEAGRHWAGWFERGQIAFDRRLWHADHYAYDDGGGASSDSIMADQLAGQWYADATGLGDLLPADRVETALRTIYRTNVCGFAGGRMGAVNGMRPDGTVDGRASSRPRSGSERPMPWRRS